jgi:hypothetical protein
MSLCEVGTQTGQARKEIAGETHSCCSSLNGGLGSCGRQFITHLKDMLRTGSRYTFRKAIVRCQAEAKNLVPKVALGSVGNQLCNRLPALR